MKRTNPRFLLWVCEELFGCHIVRSYDEDQVPCFKCACCEEIVDIDSWVHAKAFRRLRNQHGAGLLGRAQTGMRKVVR